VKQLLAKLGASYKAIELDVESEFALSWIYRTSLFLVHLFTSQVVNSQISIVIK
jgi:hypothetical protein